MQNNQPRKDDAVLGGQSPPPLQGMVLGGIEGVKLRLNSPVMEVQVAALNNALNYGDAGLRLVLQALQAESRQIQRSAYRLLRKRQEPQVKQVLQTYKPWQRFERLAEYGTLFNQCGYVIVFSDRQVIDFSPEVGITEPVNTAYALRRDYCEEAEDVVSKLAKLIQNPLAGELEALVVGEWIDAHEYPPFELIDALVAAKERLTNLKEVFIGDIPYIECEISWIQQSDISPILRAYPQLEVLQVRGGDGLEFTPPVRHDNLKALIVETGGLSRTTVAEICNLNLPALEHLELWFGSEDYGGDCWVESVNPILFEHKFPNLTYLGLRNSQFSDEIAEAVVRSPLLQSIGVLDLSMGTLSDAGAEILLNCTDVSELDLLNLSENFLSEDMIQRFSQIGTVQQLVDFEQFSQQLALDGKLHIVADRQKDEEDSYIHSRYCSVSE